MQKRYILWLGIFIVIALGHLAWPSLRIYLPHSNSAANGQLLPCPNLTQQCGDAVTQIRFSSIPQPLRPFQLQILHTGAKSVTVEMNMADMPMGLNRYHLLAQGDLWFADMALPACVQGRSDWVMTIWIEDASGKSVKSVHFQAQSR